MLKHKIIIPIIFVMLIILVVSYYFLFVRGQEIDINGKKQVGDGAEITVTRTPITPPINADYSENLIEELNKAPKVEYQYTLSSGEEVIIKIPEGVDPPSLQVVEKLYQKKQDR